MNTRDPNGANPRPTRALLALLALGSCALASLCGPVAGAGAAGLSPSSFTVSSLCSTASPERAACLGLRLVAKEPQAVPDSRPLGFSGTEQATSESPETVTPANEYKQPIPKSLTPANVLQAYSLTGITPPRPQTIGIVDAYDDANAESDLAVFSSQYGLPACTTANGCFRKVNQNGGTSPLPASSGSLERGWAQEIATDVEVAHGLCPGCRILLVEANSSFNSDLYVAENTAANQGASEISNSWGGQEPASDNSAFNHPGVVITASAGDDGYLDWIGGGQRFAEYPATSPHVVAVGGTRLNLNSSTKAWESETVWNDGGQRSGHVEGSAGGGGCSAFFTAPDWQQSLPNWDAVDCGSERAVADVSADADPYTGVSVYDSTPAPPEENTGWAVIGGTSVSSPIIAATFALAGGSQGVAYPASTLYENLGSAPATLHDVSSGSNGECLKPFKKGSGLSGCSIAEAAESCAAQAICEAGAGYDGPTGVGTPNGIDAFLPFGTAGTSSASTPPVSEAEPTPTPEGTSSPGASRAAPLMARPLISGLRLTRRALAAVNRRRPAISRLGFTFTLNTGARVRVAIARQLHVRGHMRWSGVSKPLTILAPSGRQSRHLTGRGSFTRGRYRLTLTPEHGAPRSLVFQVS
jgi:hypothetical protein